MKNIRDKIDKWFEVLGQNVIRFRWVIIVLTFTLTGFMVSQLPNLGFDMSTESFLHKEDPSILRYNKFREQFGRDETIVFMINPKNVFDLEFLKKLKSFHNRLEEKVPYVKEVNSLMNARVTIGEEGGLTVGDLLDPFPETEKELEIIKERALTNPLYQNLLVSEDGKLTTVIVRSEAYSTATAGKKASGKHEETTSGENQDEQHLLTNEENSEMVAAAKKIVTEFNSEEFPIHLTGSPIVTDFMKVAMQGDMMRFTKIAIVVIGVFLFILFRRIPGVILPLVTVLLSVVLTFSLMAITGTTIKIPLVILPSFLLAIGVGASVHLLTIFYKSYKKDRKNEAIIETLGHSGLPIVMTSITTAVGLASFANAEIAPVSDLGIFASIGVLISLGLTLFLIPALISIFPIKPVVVPENQNSGNLMDKILVACGNFAVDYHWKVTIVSLSLVAFAAAGILKLDISHNVLLWFKKGTEIRDNADLIDSKMKGTLSVEIIVDTGVENGLYEPKTLNALDKLGKRILAYKEPEKKMFVGKTISLADMVKEINRALNEDKPEAYIIPQDRKVIAQEFLLFENGGADDLENIVDSRFSITHLTAKVPWNDSVTYIDFINFIEKNCRELFDDSIIVTTTGLVEMLMKTVFAMMESTKQSYAIAFIVISILMVFLVGGVKIGLLSMIPNLSPIILTMGIMGWLRIPLDMFSMLIGSIAIGLAVDDTIHFLHNFRRYFEKTGNIKESVRETMLTTGRAMFVTTLVLATGFWLFIFASLQNLFYFGSLLGLTLIFAFLADIILAPALLTIANKDR